MICNSRKKNRNINRIFVSSAEISADFDLVFQHQSTKDYVHLRMFPNPEEISVCFWMRTLDVSSMGTIFSYSVENNQPYNSDTFTLYDYGRLQVCKPYFLFVVLQVWKPYFLFVVLLQLLWKIVTYLKIKKRIFLFLFILIIKQKIIDYYFHFLFKNVQCGMIVL